MKTTRRQMLKTSLGSLAVVSLAGTVPAFVSKLAFAQAAADPKLANDNVLLVIQLSGGNDGLNTVVPFTQDAYHKARPVIAIKDNALKLDDKLALNPGLKPFKEMFDEGTLAVVNGCGYPNPNRSHFRSMEIWQSANPKDYQPTGWLGHYIDHAAKGTDVSMPAINIGSELPLALAGEGAPVPSIQSVDDFRIKTDPATPNQAKAEEQMIRDFSNTRAHTPAMEFLSRQATNAIGSIDKIRKLAAGYKSDANYPGNFGGTLRLAAQMITANFGPRVFYCQIAGFDTHANQVGQHQGLWNNIAASIQAFMKDLKAKGLDQKVLVMAFSEFGRRVNQNNSNGTDHGTAGPVFIAGGKIKPGIHGAYPSLTELDDGDLKYTTDFRRVYAAILQRWLNAESEKPLNGNFTPLDFV